MSKTDNPVIDAENYYSEEDNRNIIGICESCGEPIYTETNYEYGDEYIKIYDCFVHFDCWDDFGRNLMK